MIGFQIVITAVVFFFWQAPPDTVDQAGPPDEPEAQEEPPEEPEQVEPIEPYEVPLEPGYNEVLTDSLLRWEMLQNPHEWHFRRPGRITYRLGLLGRNDGAIIHGHDPRHQRSFWGPVPVEDRVTGMTNPNRLPHYRFESFREQTRGIQYKNRYEMKRYYVNRPLTEITIEQSGDEYRSVEGLLSQNVSQRLNLEAAYWGKLEDSEYQGNLLLGRKGWGSATYHINDRYIGRAMILYNGLQMDEPRGYQIPDMHNFHFQSFNTIPESTSGRSSVRNTIMKASVYRRPHRFDDVNAQLTMYRDRNRRFFYSDAGNYYYRIHTTGAAGRYYTQPIGNAALDLEGNAEYSSIESESNRSMAEESWLRAEARGRLQLPLRSWLQLDGWGDFRYRSDGHEAGDVGGGINLPLSKWLHLDGAVSAGYVMPTPQQLYWISENEEDGVSGNPGLSNEEHRRAEAGGTLFPEYRFRLKSSAEVKQIREPILLNEENEFQQTGYYESWSATGSMGYYGNRLESELSVTSQFYYSGDSDPVLQELNNSGLRTWTRWSAHYENSVFDQAAYLKGGFTSWFSANAYQSGTYRPEMDYWDPHSFEQEIPPFVRLDIELSARVRSVIVRMRYANALDGVVQHGYFEQALHPMNKTRFRLGFKWILRN